MTERVPPRRGSYGIDAPYALVLLGGLIVFEIVLGVLTGRVAPFLTVPFIAAIAATVCAVTNLSWANVRQNGHMHEQPQPAD